jgi:RHS repeat-associated protein
VTEANGSTVAYDYDALYRLTSDTRTGTNPFSGSYAYDLAGNPTSYNGSSYSYNGGDLFSTVTYDGDGNPKSGTFGGYSSTLTWNDDSDLTSISNTNANITNGYGADGLRHWSQVGSNAKTFSIYANGLLVGEVSATGSPISAYTWGNGLISEHRYDTTTPTSFWYLFGPQGETRYLTNSTGAVTDTYVYSAYGELVASAGTDTNPFRYGGGAGYYSDSNTGLILCDERWYDPTTGRWLNSDPIGYDGGSDLYAYCGDNPVGALDPSGEMFEIGPPGSINLHHSWPIGFGGALGQDPLVALPAELHKQLHRLMRDYMKQVFDEGGPDLRWRRGNGGKVITKNYTAKEIGKVLKDFHDTLGEEYNQVKDGFNKVSRQILGNGGEGEENPSPTSNHCPGEGEGTGDPAGGGEGGGAGGVGGGGIVEGGPAGSTTGSGEEK